MAFKYKKVFAFVLVLAVAVVSGFSIGKIFIDSTAVAMDVVTETEEALRDDEKIINALLSRVNSGEGVEAFDGVQLFQIAENQLNNSSNFMREMFGITNSTGQIVNLRTQRIRMEDELFFYKLSPAKKVFANLSTPNLCSKFYFNYKNPNKVSLTKGSEKCFLDTSSKDTLDAILNDVIEQTDYTKKQYVSDFKTMPNTSIMPYIISSKTCPASAASAVSKNEDGTYSFTLNLSGEHLSKAALFYTWETMYTSGYFDYAFSVPNEREASPLKKNEGVSWKQVEIAVTIDENFNFRNVKYVEEYTLGSSAIPVLGKAECKNEFEDFFYFDKADILLHSFSDFKESYGRA